MTRGSLLLLALGVAGLAILAALSFAGQAVMPSYLAAWLFVLALPVGALPLVLGHDLLRRPETSTVSALRSLLPLVGVGIVLAIPVALGRASLYPTPATSNAFAAAWMGSGPVLLRLVVALAVWALFAVLARHPPTPRQMHRRSALAGLGLALHLVLGTLLVGDWVAAMDPALNSSSFGLIVLAAQSGTALCAACLLVVARGERLTPDLPVALLLLFGAWLFLHFTQYLVVWSANLPDEVPWYLSRDRGMGGSMEALAGVVLLIALVTLLTRRGALLVAGTAALILLLHLVEMFWLIVPAGRGHFSLRLADLTAAVGLIALAAGCLALLRTRTWQGAVHVRP